MPRNSIAAFALAAVLGAGTVASTGCLISPRAAGNVATAAIWTAAIAGTIVIMAGHDDHYHYEHCGHYRRWHDDRWVYYYGDHWEYYDEETGQWYYFAD
jgi:hypothetical protein